MTSGRTPFRHQLIRLVYALVKPVLFRLDPERAHELVFAGWATVRHWPWATHVTKRMLVVPPLPVQLMGLSLPNPVGLAAGLDKNGCLIDSLSDLGFGWLELGTVTPRPQPGNPRPRLFRLRRERALINRMGFNNDGAETLARRLRGRQWGQPIIGINIGKNRDTPIDRAVDDYTDAFRQVQPWADYVAINISSPNTPGLRDLQDVERLQVLLVTLKAEQARLAQVSSRYVPLAVKLAPDLAGPEIDALARILLQTAVDGVIATNTTLSRPGMIADHTEIGGLSGPPLKHRAITVVQRLHRTLMGQIPIIGVGGITSAEDAWAYLVAGADAVQLYTGLIFEGPGLPAEIVTGLRLKVLAQGKDDLAQALSAARSNHPSENEKKIYEPRE